MTISAIRKRISPRPAKLYYVSPGINWVLDWVGFYVTSIVRDNFGVRAKVVPSAHAVFHEIVHYGSLWGSIAEIGAGNFLTNQNIGTIFHGTLENSAFHDALVRIIDNQSAFAKLHTASRIMENRLIEWGVAPKKLVRIPLGVDTARFHPPTQEERKNRRRELGIHEDVVCIGSFHKDGVGSGDGNEPKPEKGPDIFLKVIEKLRSHYPLFVLLSAPARGYVKKGLDSLSVPYKHVVAADFHQVPALYHAADLYLLASREEGGPQSVLESLASGVPFVGTRVGLAPDIVQNGENGSLVDVEDIDGLVEAASNVIGDPNLKNKFITSGLTTAQGYDWTKIASRYYVKLYEPILNEFLE